MSQYVTNARLSEALYRPAGFVMIRTPLLPVQGVQALLDATRPGENIFASADYDPDILSQATNRSEAAFLDRLNALISDPLVQEAILAGSPDLYEALPHWQKDPLSKKGKHVQASLLRYLTRMSTRPTPFGLFAGVALGRVGEETNVRVAAPEAHRKRTRPDMQWLLHLVRALEMRPHVRAQLRYYTNPSIFLHGGRLHIPHLDTYGQVEAEKTASIRATPVVQRALAIARGGLLLNDLRQQLSLERPDAKAGQIESLLDMLREQGVLLSDLRPPLTCDQPVQYVLDRISELVGCDDVREQLSSVLELSREYDRQTLGHGVESLRDLYKATDVPDAFIRSELQIDMGVSMEASTISAALAAEFARAAELLLSTSAYPPQFPPLATYRRAFLERYGEAREVPILELLDEDAGLGPPPSYEHPPRTAAMQASPAPEPTSRDQLLLRLAAAALRRGSREIELDASALNELRVTSSWRDVAPATLELYASVVARSQEEIDRGNFQLVIGPRIGAHPAGKSFGRFCDVLGEGSVQSLVELASIEDGCAPGSIIAELVYLPTYGHLANIAVRPALRRHEICLFATPGVPREDQIPLDDLVVGVRNDRFYIRSLARGVEVIASSTHMLGPLMAPNVCRFLEEVAKEGKMPLHAFTWGAAEHLSFLPRVRVGRIVLSLAEWHLPPETIKMGAASPEPAAWFRHIQEWRALWNVPRYVYEVERDNKLLLDLESPICMAQLSLLCQRRAASNDPLTLQEMLPDFDNAWTTGVDGRYMLELVVPLVRQQLPPAPEVSMPRSSGEPVPQAVRLRQPGSDWLYAKLYSGRSRQEDLLGGPVRQFANKAIGEGLAERWFFIRYADPNPHVRLRFHGDPSTLMTRLLPALTAWSHSLVESGLVQKLVLDSYDREIERYGGPEGIEIAEQIFAADSLAVADLLALRLHRLTDLAPIDLAVLSIDDLLASLGLPASERLRLYRLIGGPREKAQDKSSRVEGAKLQKRFHGYRKLAQRLLGDRAWLLSQPGGTFIAQCLQHRAEALGLLGGQLRALADKDLIWTPVDAFLASCVHMHCVRLLGLNRPWEEEAIYFLERTLESLERYVPEGVALK